MAIRDLDNKKCLITGAASGIGRAIAVQAAREGAHLFLTDVDAGRLEAVVAEIESAGGTVSYHAPADVSDYEAVAGMADQRPGLACPGSPFGHQVRAGAQIRRNQRESAVAAAPRCAASWTEIRLAKPNPVANAVSDARASHARGRWFETSRAHYPNRVDEGRVALQRRRRI